jgi:protein tyrosine phosphatase (PTP) superfamily phosphohydrolase (DUF442 family)
MFVAACVYLTGQRGLPPQNGILNFGKVDDRLYRGAQPDAAGIESLQSLGIKSIINLRKPDEKRGFEEVQAKSAGILFTNIPLPGLSRPEDADIAKILSLIDSLPPPVFVHCEHGCDRTGTVIAAYRIRHDQWTVDAALGEADRYGMSSIERGMKDFIRDFGKATTNKLSGAR